MQIGMTCMTARCSIHHGPWEWMRLQVSPGGAYVATYDKHSLHIWATRHADCKPLTLHHTKAFTVRALPCTCPTPAALLNL